MNKAVGLNIIELALSVAQSLTSENDRTDVTIADTLEDIVRIAAQAYRDHTGEEMDPSLIKAEDSL